MRNNISRSLLYRYLSTAAYTAAFIIAFTAALTTEATAQGIVVDRDWRFGNVVLESSDVDVQIRNNIAHVTIDHEFRNTGRLTAEGIFLFPIPEDASIADFQMEMNGRLASGEVLPADEARQVYQQIVRKNLDPALLEWVDGRSFRASIFPIAANATQRIVLEYDMPVEQVGNRFRFVHPLAGTVTTNQVGQPRRVWNVRHGNVPGHSDENASSTAHGDKAAAQLSMTISINSGSDTELRNVYSPSHEVDLEYRNEHAAHASLTSLNDANSNFVLYYSLDTDRISATLIPFRPYRDKPGYFMLMVAPPTKPKGEDVQPKDIVFVLDTSGSMAGEKIEQAKSALKYALNRLGKDDSFGLVAFNSDIDVFTSSMAKTSRVEDALYFVDQISARGGTNINAAVLRAIDLLKGARNGSIVFLTDGLPSSGVTDVDQIIKNVTSANKDDVTLFSFGVGYDVNTRLLGDLSESTSAFAEYVAPEENLEETVSLFYERIRFPVMTNVSIDIPHAGVHSMAPGNLPDLFVGDPLVITGRYRQSGKTTAVLTGMINGKRTKLEYTLDFPAIARKESFVSQTWATRRVGQLLSDIRRNGEDSELKDEIVALATEFGIVTPYTSYLVTEDSEESLSMVQSGLSTLRRRLNGSNAAASELPSFSPASSSGAEAVSASKQLNRLQQADSYDKDLNIGIQTGGQNFVQYEDGTWKSSAAEKRLLADKKPTVEIEFASEAYFAFLERYPDAKEYLRVGDNVTFVFRDQTVRIGPNGEAKVNDKQFRDWFGS